MLTKCPDCGKEISKNAAICPHCKCNIVAFRKTETRPCRICKTPLIVQDHLSMVYTSTPQIIDRSSVVGELKYTPCPKCGEPRPILPDSQDSPTQDMVRKLVLAAFVLAAIGLGYVAYLKYAGS